MNTPMIHWQQYNRPLELPRQRSTRVLYQFMDRVTRYLASALTAVGVITAAVWLINQPSMLLYLQVTVWTAGLVFLGVALEAQKLATTWVAVATGIALPVLAYLSKNQAPELLIVAASLVAGWLCFAVYQFGLTARR